MCEYNDTDAHPRQGGQISLWIALQEVRRVPIAVCDVSAGSNDRIQDPGREYTCYDDEIELLLCRRRELVDHHKGVLMTINNNYK